MVFVSTELGISLGVALLGSPSADVYRNQNVVPDDATAAAAGQARDALAGAVDVAPHLPDSAAGQLITSAPEAFTGGLNLAAIIAAGVIGVLALA